MEYNKNAYLQLLSKEFTNAKEVTEEIINLEAILKLPKGTEIFLSDLHGEYEPFVHILNNGAGRIKAKINALYQRELYKKDMDDLATLIYYPEERLRIIKSKNENTTEWYIMNLRRLVEVCREVGTKYSRSKVRKTLPKNFAYIIDELLHAASNRADKEEYYQSILDNIVELGAADDLIKAISKTIKRLAIDYLHVVGDIFDRGQYPDLIIYRLMKLKYLDIQWGNHDILWMAAACGNDACIANLVRICARYDNIRVLEDRYGINIRPLSIFALQTYKENPGEKFLPKIYDYNKYADTDNRLLSKINKAMTIIQFKLEGQLIQKHPEYKMENRLLLDKIDYRDGTIKLNGKIYKLNDKYFPTIDPKHPYSLTKEEKEIVERLHTSFTSSSKLKEHVKFLYDVGSTYKIFNSNLLIHACIPVNEDGSFTKVKVLDKELEGKELLDYLDKVIAKAYYSENNAAKDYMWYLWCGKDSPFFGKEKMTTFERYFIDDKETHIEKKIPYYTFITEKKNCEKILKAFGIEEEFSHVINGHTPVKSKDGESPVRAEGKLLVIDGGFAKAYREKTGKAGYTLAYNSRGLVLNANNTPPSIKDAVRFGEDLQSEIIVDARTLDRKTVADTDIGKELRCQIEALKALLEEYRKHNI